MKHIEENNCITIFKNETFPSRSEAFNKAKNFLITLNKYTY